MCDKISALLSDEVEKMLYIQNYLREQFKEKLSDSKRRRAILTDVLNDPDCWAALAEPPDVAKERILKIIEERYA
jgi:siroheme synthase (precorrin-2 oxidase/ferrochelatase)